MRIFIDKNFCMQCGYCERLVHGFKTRCNGDIFVSEGTYSRSEEVRESLRGLIECCPNEAIRLSPHPIGFRRK